MDLYRTVGEMEAAARRWRAAGRRIGLVPTMGSLHEGHLSLVRLARAHADAVVVSLFVNPTQFGPNEDLAAYPRDREGDRRRCAAEGADALFCPEAADVYRPGHSVCVVEERLAAVLCGASRPGHFRGVLTVVAKLFNIVGPDVAVFGEKDAQQLRLVEQMVRDLNFPVRIVRGPTVREPDGLAMSSRNACLTPAEREQARGLSAALRCVEERVAAGERSAARLVAAARAALAAAPDVHVEYLEIVDADSLQPVEILRAPALAVLAARVGRTRLIDNVRLHP